MTVNTLWLYGAALGLGALGALAVALFGRRWALLDIPNERSSHAQETPRGGGIGIAAAFVVSAILCAAPAGVWIPAALLAIISFREDRFEISIAVRLLFHFVLAGCFLFFIAMYHFYYSGYLWGLMLSVFYLIFIVGTANFYNFMDGINGIAGITGTVAFGLLGAYGISTGRDPALICLCFSLACACLGFLPFNLPRARVFMGDVGSILLGFVFACLVVMWSASASEFLLLSAFLFLFYADELITLRERIRDGESPVRAHRRHLYQMLANERGLAHWQVSAGYGMAQLVIGLAVWKAGDGGLPAILGVLAFSLVVFILVNNRIKRPYRSGD
jgi:Fuc2NAc and GlcNAc transferase